MKRLFAGFVGLALFTVGCSGTTPSSPSGVTSAASQASAPPASGAGPSSPSVDPTPGGPAANATAPQYTLTGPRSLNNCFTAGTDPMQWILNVTDAGPRHLRFVALAHQDDTPGCDATTKNPRARLDVTGVTDYTPHSSGQTVFTFNPRMYNCGRVQVDVSIFDAAGNEILLIVAVLNYGTQCEPQLVCTPPSGTTPLGLPYTFTATGGNGTYTWSTVPASGGTPASGSGATFTQTYSVDGTYVATVRSGTQTASCTVVAGSGEIPDVECRPPTQTVQLNELANVFAVRGNGTYSWSAPGGTPSTGSGANFSTLYASPGTKTISVTSAGITRSCTVIVPPQEFICAPPTQTVNLNQAASVSVVTSAPGPFTWSAPGGSTSTGTGTSFSTSYATPGTKLISVTNGTLTATCEVIVPPPPSLVCQPPTQTVNINQTATVTASGGTGVYSWAAPGGSTPTGSGGTFSTSYPVAGTNTITVTSGTETATCTVVVPPPSTPICTPPTQTVLVNQTATMGATQGTGTYSWSAPGGTPSTGTGATFGTAYGAPGTYTVTLTSGGLSSTCQVIVPPPLVCAPPNQSVLIGQAANMSASGGTGTYSWAAPGGTTTSGSGATFSTAYGTAGGYAVTVTSGTQTATCNVTVTSPPNSCAGTTAVINSLVFPTGVVTINVPAGQQSQIRIDSTDHNTEITTTYNYTLGPGSTVLNVPIACFPKVEIFCGTVGLGAQRGVNQCGQ